MKKYVFIFHSDMTDNKYYFISKDQNKLNKYFLDCQIYINSIDPTEKQTKAKILNNNNIFILNNEYNEINEKNFIITKYLSYRF
ncbi:hypothetical protein J6Q66_08830 [bacterium]|nr:hypothetical protein [bacterium]